MFSRHITAVVGISSFCLGIWMDRKYRELSELNTSHRIPGFKIFDAVYADGIVANNQELIINNNNNDQRISQVYFAYLITFNYNYYSYCLSSGK